MTDLTDDGEGVGRGPPEPGDFEVFGKWLAQQPREWSVVVATRAALRVLPLSRLREERHSSVVLPVFRATALVRFAARFPDRAIESSAFDAAASAALSVRAALAPVVYAVRAAAHAARTVRESPDGASIAAASAVRASARAALTGASAVEVATGIRAAPAVSYDAAFTAALAAVKADAQLLYEKRATPGQLAITQLWITPSPEFLVSAWQALANELLGLGSHWSIWTDWYEDVRAGISYATDVEAKDASFTDLPGQLPWDAGAEAVNTEIARRLREIRSKEVARSKSSPKLPKTETISPR